MTYVVLTKVEYKPEMEKAAINAGLKTIEFAQDAKGLIDISVSYSSERCETIMFWEWESKSDHDNYMRSPNWKQHGAELALLLPFDRIKFSSQSFERLA